MTPFPQTAVPVLASRYPGNTVTLTHQLASHPLFSMESLLQLAASLPEQSVEYNLGDLPVSQDPDGTPENGLGITETIRRIGECNSWMVLKRVEEDPDYAALMNDCLDALQPAIAPHTGRMLRREAFIFISSPGSVTPFHMDPEHNILMQIRGHKQVRIFPANDPLLVSAQQHEDFHNDGHRNLPYREDFAGLAEEFTLQPGEAVYFPVKAPHWVQNGDEVSVSFSITWRSRHSEKMAVIHHANRLLRRTGLNPAPAGLHPARDTAKIAAYSCLQKLQSLAK